MRRRAPFAAAVVVPGLGAGEAMSEIDSRFSVCVFCGAKPGLDPEFAQVARAAGRAIAERGWRMVYGGGRVGLMGVAADAALAAGGDGEQIQEGHPAARAARAA